MDFPEHVALALDALGNGKRREILLLLQAERGLSYSELRGRLGWASRSKGTLNYHMGMLKRAGLIANYAEERPGGQYYSYYGVSTLCGRLVDSIFGVYEGERVAQENVSASRVYKG